VVASVNDAAVLGGRVGLSAARFQVLERRDIREAVRITFWLVSGVFLVNGTVLASQSPVFAAASFCAVAAMLALQLLWRHGGQRRPHQMAFAIGVVIMAMGIPAAAMTPVVASMVAGEFAAVVVGCSVFIPWGYRWHGAYLAMAACTLVAASALLRVDEPQRLAVLIVGVLAIGTSLVGNMFTRQRRERAWAQEFRLRQQRAELRRTVARLDAANMTIERLEGILPICAACKHIRDGAEWSPVETYISAHSSALFSHGICPDCERRLYGEVTGAAV
jgi:hypothetical protein